MSFRGWQTAFEAPVQTAKRHKFDGWTTLLSGLNTTTWDKRFGGSFCAQLIAYDQARAIWRGDDLGARIVETVPNEMLRQGYEICTEDKTLQEWVTARHEELGIANALHECLKYERGYGGGALLLGAQDGALSLAEPLNMKTVRSFDFVTVLEPRELSVLRYYSDPRAPKFGEPELYTLAPMSQGGVTTPLFVIHESRVVIFGGIRVSRMQVSDTGGSWGDNIFTRCGAVLRDFNLSWSAASILVMDFAQAIYKIEGLAELIGLDKEDEVMTRIKIAEMSRSTARAMMIDAQDEFERKQTPIAGLPEMLEKFMYRLAAAAEMPLTMLMGMSPGGLNATGDSDIRLFYDRIKSMQTKKLEPALTKVTQLIFAAGSKQEPDKWGIEFCPLWQPTQKEIADTRYTQAQTDAIYLQWGVVSPEEVAISRFGGDKYSMETVIDFAKRKKVTPPPMPAPGGDRGGPPGADNEQLQKAA